MVIERLLKDISPAAFVDRYYSRIPYSVPGGAAAFTHLGTWARMEKILNQPQADVLIVRQGILREGKDRPSKDRIKELHAAGYTLLARNAQKHDPELAELASGFEKDFQAPINIHIYCTPASQYGFGWHYDAEEVFILQTHGRKDCSLRKNTVNPWPLEETIPQDMKFEREVSPVLKCSLVTGDWLYIPSGYWHRAEAVEESITLAVGVMAPAAIRVYDFLRRHLLTSPIWRQRLPVTGRSSPSGTEEQVQNYQKLFAELGEDLSRIMRQETLVRSFLDRLMQQPAGPDRNDDRQTPPA